MQHLIGKELGPYRITDYIASGGMALVYRGVHTTLGREVAIKVLLPHLADNQQFIQRFNREAMNAAKVQHPNLLHVYDVGHVDNLHYMVMDYASGGTLEELLQRRLTIKEITTIVAQLADGLAAAHGQGIIHRDLKPSNVLFSSDGIPMLADFGIALAIAGTRLTSTGTSLGTPQYMSPEQAIGGAVDHRTDIYSLGVMLYQMLTGKLPFDGDTLPAIINKQLHEAPPPLPAESNIPRQLQHILWKSMMKEPNKRWNSAQEMADALRGHRKVTTVKRKAILPRQPRRIPLSAFVLLLIALIAVGAFAVVLASRTPPEAETVEIVITATTDPNQPTPQPDETLEPVVIVITATGEATATPTAMPNQTPTQEPSTKTPTEEARETATKKPTEEATEEATQEPTEETAEEPTSEPTQVPTQVPTATTIPNTPTLIPTQELALVATEPPLPTNTPIPTLPPATNTPLPTQPPATATSVPATATLPPATATLPPPPTATLPPPATATLPPPPTATLPPPPTATLPPPPTATLPPPTATQPPPTDTPLPPPTDTPLPPTATEVPPTPTIPPPPTATEVQLPPVVLLEPHDEAAYKHSSNTLNDTITFRWQWNGTLKGSQRFDLRVWKDQPETPHNGIAGPRITTHDIRASTLDPSHYFWTVVVFDPDTGLALTEETTPRRFSVSK